MLSNIIMRSFSSIPLCNSTTHAVAGFHSARPHFGGWSVGCGPLAFTGKGTQTNQIPNGVWSAWKELVDAGFDEFVIR